MILDDLMKSTGEWLRGTGAEVDVVVSSRIRLARNLADFPFTNRASPMQKGELETLIRERLGKSNGLDLTYLQVHTLNTLDREFLRERQLISREHVGAEGPRGVAFEARETRSIMVNEEDHLRLQVLRSGFVLDEAWEDIDKLDDAIEERINYAFSEEFGYLTACPTNVGTGMRASVMLHLPALHYTKQLEKVFRSLQKINLAVRGLYGEGTRASGDFYQISNQVTLGKSEPQILTEIREVIPQIITYERLARETLVRETKALI
ncbi:MAG TPA: ATP--guanido phosphotransferase, partial [Gemmatales bacterium]|nr:ATP--guanido phosphotransferase [Gemmatales bacterium]